MEEKSEIFSQRLVKAVLWNISLQTILAILLIFIIQIDILHPFSWITSTLNDILSWRMGLNVILLGLVSFFQAYIYGSYYTKPVPKRFTRFSMFLSIFSIQNIIFSVLYALNGYFTMALYSSLAKSNFTELKKACDNHDGLCLAEQSLFLQFGGMWMGLYYFLNVYIFGTAVLTFPHVYQNKLQQIKLATSNVLSQGFKNSMVPVAYYSVFYYFWGNKPRSVVADVYSLYSEDPPLDSIFNLVSSGIWIGLWFYTSLFFVSVYTMRTVFNIILTEPMKFPIESNTLSMTLFNALSQKNQFTGYLGALDLKIMSMTDPIRRSYIYTLSQPGGHPRNWTNLLENCTSILNSFSKELDIINGDNNPSETDRSYAKSKLNVTPPSLYPGSLRNMAQSPYLMELKDHNKNKVENTFMNALKEDFNSFLNKLCQKPGINYFFGELTDTRLKFVLIQAQPIMWTCEGLAHITAASLKEDKYGVIQNDLPVVILALVTLKQNLEKLTKPGLAPRKHILNDILAMKIKSALLSSVKRSLYKIILTFSKYIHEIPLDSDVQIAIQPFLCCKEP